jgi:hypothetical protein
MQAHMNLMSVQRIAMNQNKDPNTEIVINIAHT